MIKRILDSLNIESYKEQFFTESIDGFNIKIYPFYDLDMILNSRECGSFSIKPIAIIICELDNAKVTDYYLHYFDEYDNNETYTNNILNRFCNEILESDDKNIFS